MSQVEFEPTIPATDRPQRHTLDHAGTGIVSLEHKVKIILVSLHVKFRLCVYHLLVAALQVDQYMQASDFNFNIQIKKRKICYWLKDTFHRCQVPNVYSKELFV
jgi:hypothetical protein